MKKQEYPLRRISNLPWWLQCISLWFFVFLLLTLVGFITVSFGDFGSGYLPKAEYPLTSIPGLWARWDSYFYLLIATKGYSSNPLSYGFFPIFPALIALVSKLTSSKPALSGLVIAQLSYLGAILGLYKLARLIRDDHSYAMYCVISMMLFPTSFFFLAIYAEPLYLAFAILATYLALSATPRYILAGVAIGVAAATRPVGWLLNIPLISEILRNRKLNISSILTIAVVLFFSVIGVVIFVYYLYTLTGTFLAIPQSQANWHRHWQFPWVTYGKSLFIAFTGNRVPGDWFLYVINWVDLAFTTLALILTALAIWGSIRKQFPWSLSFYLVASLAFLLSSEGPYLAGSDHLDVIPLWGMCRWVAALFPLYLVIGMWIRSRKAMLMVVLISGLWLIIFTAWWISGRWVG